MHQGRFRITRYARRALLAVAVGACSAAFPAASGAAVTVGESTAANGGGTRTCSTNNLEVCTWVIPTAPGPQYASPVDGVITSWRVRGDSKDRQFALRVLHDNGDGTWTGAGTSEAQQVVPPGENTFATRLPIRAGEYIGINIPGRMTIPPYIETRSSAGARADVFNPVPLGDGETRAPFVGDPTDTLFLCNATVEPDCDGDGLGDETQDPEIRNCNPAARSLNLQATKSKVKKGRKVQLGGVLDSADAECQAGGSVELQRRKPSQPDSAFTTFTTVKTASNGQFNAEVKVKKSFVYRALAPASPFCQQGTSSGELVKVK